jgi:hypothetical protein
MRRQNVPLSARLRALTWYHGTPSIAAAESILVEGLRPGRGRGSGAWIAPQAGAVYLTLSENEAIKYALGFLSSEDYVPLESYGWVFAFEGLTDLEPDEDYVGAAAYAGVQEVEGNEEDYADEDDPYGHNPLLGFAAELQEGVPELVDRIRQIAQRVLTKQQQADLVIGFRLPLLGKALLPHLGVAERLGLLEAGAPGAHFGAVLLPVAAWRLLRGVGEVGEDAEEVQQALEDSVSRGATLQGGWTEIERVF